MYYDSCRQQLLVNFLLDYHVFFVYGNALKLLWPFLATISQVVDDAVLGIIQYS